MSDTGMYADRYEDHYVEARALLILTEKLPDGSPEMASMTAEAQVHGGLAAACATMARTLPDEQDAEFGGS